MKALRARVNGGFGGGFRSAGAITMLWSLALGQATPDTIQPLPEPTMLHLLGIGAAALLLLSRRRR